jgi:hypothetical protein
MKPPGIVDHTFDLQERYNMSGKYGLFQSLEFACPISRTFGFNGTGFREMFANQKQLFPREFVVSDEIVATSLALYNGIVVNPLAISTVDSVNFFNASMSLINVSFKVPGL